MAGLALSLGLSRQHRSLAHTLSKAALSPTEQRPQFQAQAEVRWGTNVLFCKPYRTKCIVLWGQAGGWRKTPDGQTMRQAHSQSDELHRIVFLFVPMLICPWSAWRRQCSLEPGSALAEQAAQGPV
jgi:hypothetical protein